MRAPPPAAGQQPGGPFTRLLQQRRILGQVGEAQQCITTLQGAHELTLAADLQVTLIACMLSARARSIAARMVSDEVEPAQPKTR